MLVPALVWWLATVLVLSVVILGDFEGKAAPKVITAVAYGVISFVCVVILVINEQQVVVKQVIGGKVVNRAGLQRGGVCRFLCWGVVVERLDF
jgi:hypothetical protein